MWLWDLMMLDYVDFGDVVILSCWVFGVLNRLLYLYIYIRVCHETCEFVYFCVLNQSSGVEKNRFCSLCQWWHIVPRVPFFCMTRVFVHEMKAHKKKKLSCSPLWDTFVACYPLRLNCFQFQWHVPCGRPEFQHLSRFCMLFFQHDIDQMLAYKLHTMRASWKIISVVCEEYVPDNVKPAFFFWECHSIEQNCLEWRCCSKILNDCIFPVLACEHFETVGQHLGHLILGKIMLHWWLSTWPAFWKE